jgi:plasmid stabilization system protein ParE
MPRRVLLSTRAERWLHREVSYLAERNVSAARRLLDRIEDARRQLAAFPRSGRPGLVPGTRLLVVASYVVTYRERAADLEIIDIRHGRQAARE